MDEVVINKEFMDFVKEIEQKKLIDNKTRLILTETPANPTLDIIDLRDTAKLASKHNIATAVDTTFATFYFQKPLELGIDISLYSATKFIGGHSDAIGGLAISSKKLIEQIKDETLVDMGGVMSPFNAFLFLRGLKTLAVRMDRHNANAMKIAQFLEEHPKIEKVFYPFLESHPQYQ